MSEKKKGELAERYMTNRAWEKPRRSNYDKSGICIQTRRCSREGHGASCLLMQGIDLIYARWKEKNQGFDHVDWCISMETAVV